MNTDLIVLNPKLLITLLSNHEIKVMNDDQEQYFKIAIINSTSSSSSYQAQQSPLSFSKIKSKRVIIDKDSIRLRVEDINSKTPFQIDYTPLLEETIINYLEIY